MSSAAAVTDAPAIPQGLSLAWYRRGRDGGEPPSQRFDVLGSSKSDLLTDAIVELHAELARSIAAFAPGGPASWAWNEIVSRLALSEAEAAFLLGLLHDARPSIQAVVRPPLGA